MIKNKERIIWILVLVFIFTISLFNIYEPSKVNAQNKGSSDDFFHYTKLFQKVFISLQQNYVDEGKVSTKDLMYGAIKGMLEATEDPFTQFLDEELNESFAEEMSGKFGGVGLSIILSDDKNWIMVLAPVEDGPSEDLGILPGDLIAEIDGESAEGKTASEVSKLLRGKAGTKVRVGMKRTGVKDLIYFDIKRDIVNIKSVKYKMLEDKIGYVRVTTFGNDTAKDFKDALLDLKKDGVKDLIIDMRNNPGGRLDTAIEMADMLLTDGKIVYVRGRHKQQDEDFYASKKLDILPDIPVTLLVNKYSASASEVFAGALQDNERATIIGEKTFGKFSVQYVLPLDEKDKTAFKLTIAHYYTPNGRKLHGEGIPPDFLVEEKELTDDDINAMVKIREGTYLTDYIKKYPNENADTKQIAILAQELEEYDIKIDTYILERLVYVERHKSDYKEIVNLKYDKQLKAAIEYMNTGKIAINK